MSENNFDDIKIKVEAVLFSYADWVTANEIKEALNIDSGKLIENSLRELKKKFESGFSFIIEESDEGKWRMVLREEYNDTISELVSGVEIPKPVLKVLSIIVYEQPITKTKLSEIIGRYVKPEVDYLYKAKFINYEKQGIGKYYRVTKKFFDYFKIDNEEEFRKQANSTIKTFLEEPIPISEQEKTNEQEENIEKKDEEDLEFEKNN